MSQKSCENFVDSKFISSSSSLHCDFCFPSHELPFVILKCGSRHQREAAKSRALPAECVSKPDPGRDPYVWDTWGMCHQWVEISIES